MSLVPKIIEEKSNKQSHLDEMISYERTRSVIFKMSSVKMSTNCQNILSE